ncbi:EF-hand domain-containing protein [Trichonephila inaurata madagascariensis]|uniref:EF-hand domain-containing protein n=1 Tax=Trichonephila inaurata madagascariensis TaxID=2747483 RepID=A0A8X6WL48_9ARAC|nr:EF-hand domain-containing protein [Trichonephila inaurata madagascariensis]
MADKNFQEAFDLICTTSGGKDGKLTFENIKQWFKQAGVIGPETGITDTDVQTAFSEAVKDEKEADFTKTKELVSSLGKAKDKDPKELMEKLGASAPPKMGQGTDPGAKVGKGTM